MLTQAETDILNQAAQDFGSGVTNLGRGADLFGMDSFTLSVTLNLNSLSGGNQRVLWNHTQYGIVINDNDLQVVLRGADGNLNYYTVPDAFDATGWHDIQVTYDDGSDALKLYLDGQEVYSTTTADVDLTAPSYWDVTAGGTLWGDMLDGQVADVSVLDSAIEIDGSQSITERMLAIDELDPIVNVDVEVTGPTDPAPEPKTEEELLHEAAEAFGSGTVNLGSDPAHYNLDDLTFSITFSMDTLTAGKQILLDSPGQYSVYVYRDDLFIQMRNEKGSLVRTRINDVFDETGWHDVQITVDQAANEFKVYSDGNLLLTKAADWISLGEGAFKGVTAGGNRSGYQLQGEIADVSIHNEALPVDGSESLYDRMYTLDDGNLAPKYEIPTENTAAVISGEDALFIAEDDLAASGKLDIVDPDAGEAAFVAGNIAGEFGSFEIDANGQWIYSPSSDKVNALAEGEKAVETITVTSVDGTEHVITVTIEGSNDVPLISGIASGYIAEEGPLVATGKLFISDADAGESAFVASAIEGVFGTLVIDAAGNWTYNASGNDALVALGAGETAIDAISVMSVDGTRHLISINVSGTDSEAVISGVDTGVIKEDGAQFVEGKLNVADMDAGESGFKAGAVAGDMGVLTIDAAGNWSYAVSDQAAMNLLGEGDVVIEVVQVQTLDGTTHNITIELQGANDSAIITGVNTGEVVEDNNATASGKLNIEDADYGEATFVAGVMQGTYGALTLQADGNWVYAANNSGAIQHLGEGQSSVETFKVSSADGTEHVISVTVVGTNDAAVISGVAEGSVAESGPLTASGQLNISDADAGEGRFAAAAINGVYGTLVIDEYGNWSYNASGNEALRALGENETTQDVIEVSSVDGTTHLITISVSGSDNEAIITGVDTGVALDDGTPTAAGKLNVTDMDAGQSAFVPESLTGEFGTLVIDADGNWLYQANESTAFKGLGYGDTLKDTITVRTVGGTEHSIAITLEGTDDAPIVSGVSTGTVGEDGPLFATGKLDIFDFDTGESVFIAASVAGDYGTLTIDEAGNWSYDASGNAALEALGEGDVAQERLEVLTADGTVQEIVITVVGGDSEAVISGVDTGSVTEDSVLTASGKLAVSDKDTGQSAFVAATVTGAYGALVIDADGNWTYNADNSALQSLGAGDVAVENLTVQTVDGSTHVIAVDLQGTNDAAEITGTSTGTVEEDGNLTASGQLNITDADSGEASFQAGSINGAYGTLDIDSSGNWTYTANNGSNMQALNSGELATDSLKVYAADGTEHTINIAVKGQDEPVDPGDSNLPSEAELLAAAAAEFGSGVKNLGRDPALFGMESFTLSATFELDSLSGGNQAIVWNHMQYGVSVIDNDVQLTVRGADGALDYHRIPDVFSEAGWQDVQFTYDAGTSQIQAFVNGELVSTVENADVALTEPLYWDVTVGGTPWGNAFKGQIADVSISDIVNTPQAGSLYERMYEMDGVDNALPIAVSQQEVGEYLSTGGGGGTAPIELVYDEDGSIIVNGLEELEALLQHDISGATLKLMPGDYVGLNINDFLPSEKVTITSYSEDDPARIANFRMIDSSSVSFEGIDFIANSTSEAGYFVAFVDRCEDIEFLNNKFAMGSDELRDAGIGGLGIEETIGAVVKGNEFTNITRGASYDRSEDLVVEDNYLHNLRSDGFNFISVKNVLIDSNEFYDVHPIEGDHADYIQFWTTNMPYGSENVVIRNNFMAQSGGGSAQGIFIRDENSVGYKNFLIENNMVYQSAYHGITAGGVDGLSIIGNTVLSTVGMPEQLWVRVYDSQNVDVDLNVSNRFLLDENNLFLTENGNVWAPFSSEFGADYQGLFENGSLDFNSNEMADFLLNDSVEAGARIDSLLLQGSEFVGNTLDNQILGDENNNFIAGFQGDDLLSGGLGDDTLFGGWGSDTLEGGDGSDTFLFRQSIDSLDQVDTITDFGADDFISFEGLVQGEFKFIGSDQFSLPEIRLEDENEMLNKVAKSFGEGVVELGQDPSLFSLDEFTVSITFELNSLTGGRQGLLYSHTQYSVYVNNDGLQFEFNSIDGQIIKGTLSNVFQATGWHDVQLIMDPESNQFNIWADGQNLYKVDVDAGFQTAPVNSWGVVAGGTPWGYPLDGQIADVSVVNQVVEIEESASIFQRAQIVDENDSLLSMDLSTGNTEVRFDEALGLLQVDLDGDTSVDLEVEMIGVKLDDLSEASFLY